MGLFSFGFGNNQNNNTTPNLFGASNTFGQAIGSISSKLVVLLGDSPEKEEATRKTILGQLQLEIRELDSQIQKLSNNSTNTTELNELLLEKQQRELATEKLSRITALDISSDIFDYVNIQTETTIRQSLNNSDSTIVNPDKLSILEDTPKKKVVTLTIKQPQPTLSDLQRRDISDEIFDDLYEEYNTYESGRDDVTEALNKDLLTSEQNTLPEEQIIKRILDSTSLDEELEQEIIKQENKLLGKVILSPETRDKKRQSIIDDEFSDTDWQDRILRKLLGGPLQKDIDGTDPLTNKDGQQIPTQDYQVTRNNLGYIVSTEEDNENKLDVVLVNNKLIRRNLFENVVNTQFEQTELPFVTESTIERLEREIVELNNDIAELSGLNSGLLNSRQTQQSEIITKEQTIETLQQQIEDLQARFAVTPTEGQFFSVPPQYPSREKEDLDYWLIENGERRRIKNYAMVQLMLDQRNKTIYDVLPVEPSNIRKIKRGADVTVKEAAGEFWKVQKAAENNIYIPDQVLSGGNLKILYDDLQSSINEHISFGRVMDWMWNIGDILAPKAESEGTSAWTIQDLKPDVIYHNLNRDFRYYLAAAAIYQSSLQVNAEYVSKQKALAEQKAIRDERIKKFTDATARVIPQLLQLMLQLQATKAEVSNTGLEDAAAVAGAIATGGATLPLVAAGYISREAAIEDIDKELDRLQGIIDDVRVIEEKGKEHKTNKDAELYNEYVAWMESIDVVKFLEQAKSE
jgi:hypothetical protein